MIMRKNLHTRDNVDRLHVSRKEGGRELASIEYSVDALIQRFEDCIKKCRGGRITATRNNTDVHEDQQKGNNQKTKMGKNNFK